MYKVFYFFFIFFTSICLRSQELSAQFIVNADLVNQTNQQIFETLERSINEFINTQSWSNQEVLEQEKIKCSFILNLSSYSSTRFKGTLQVQSQRTIFNSNYDSPVLNFMDRDINFNYQEFQPLFYGPGSYQSNLVSIISFYAYFILGINADTFSLEGGNLFFDQAQRIVNLAQQGGDLGWKQNDSNRNRFWLIDTIRSNTFREYRESLYIYHRSGLDLMTENTLDAKRFIMNSLLPLEKLYIRRPNALPLQLFFDAKSEEVVNIFSEGPEIDIDLTLEMLKKIAPFYLPQWKQIK